MNVLIVIEKIFVVLSIMITTLIISCLVICLGLVG